MYLNYLIKIELKYNYLINKKDYLFNMKILLFFLYITPSYSFFQKSYINRAMIACKYNQNKILKIINSKKMILMLNYRKGTR